MSSSDTTSPNRSRIGKRPSRLIFLILLGVLFLLGIQTWLKPLPEVPLAGASPKVSLPDDAMETWWTGEWQSAAERRANQDFALRPAMIRLINQLRFSLFDEHNPYITEGSSGYWFEEAYRETVCGRDYLGEDSLQRVIRDLDRFRNRLLKDGKRLVIMIAPNKWRTLHNKIDWNCDPGPTNYQTLVPELQSRGYALVDGIETFVYEQRHKPAHPIHSKQGTHWSIFGAALSIDYLRFAFAQEGITLPKVRFDSLEVSDEPRNTDKDLHDLLNIMVDPAPELLAYPSLSFEGDYKPRVCVIGDSYYWSYYTLGAHQGLFGLESKFFYYNQSMVTEHPSERVALTDDLRRAELAQCEAVLLVFGEPSLKHLAQELELLNKL